MDGNILLWIQDHLRWEGMNWFWKGITSLGNGGWFWIVLCILMVVLAKIPGEKYSIKDENINCVNPKQKPQKMVEMIGYEIDNLLKNVKKEFGIVFKMKEIKEIRL